MSQTLAVGGGQISTSPLSQQRRGQEAEPTCGVHASPQTSGLSRDSRQHSTMGAPGILDTLKDARSENIRGGIRAAVPPGTSCRMDAREHRGSPTLLRQAAAHQTEAGVSAAASLSCSHISPSHTHSHTLINAPMHKLTLAHSYMHINTFTPTQLCR